MVINTIGKKLLKNSLKKSQALFYSLEDQIETNLEKLVIFVYFTLL